MARHSMREIDQMYAYNAGLSAAIKVVELHADQNPGIAEFLKIIADLIAKNAKTL